jgi:hypothetical protein
MELVITSSGNIQADYIILHPQYRYSFIAVITFTCDFVQHNFETVFWIVPHLLLTLLQVHNVYQHAWDFALLMVVHLDRLATYQGAARNERP